MYMGRVHRLFDRTLTPKALCFRCLRHLPPECSARWIYAFLTVTLKANQNVTGLTLTIFGTGFANFFGEMLIAATQGGAPKLSAKFSAKLAEIPIPVLSPIFHYYGRVLFSHNLLVYLAVVIALLSWAYIKYTRAGLNLRATGENPAAADASGLNVTRIKYVNILLGGGICGIGGAYISLLNGNGVWNNGCVNGQGWIAVALVIFSSWSPAKAIFARLYSAHLQFSRCVLASLQPSSRRFHSFPLSPMRSMQCFLPCDGSCAYYNLCHPQTGGRTTRILLASTITARSADRLSCLPLQSINGMQAAAR